MPLTTLPRFLTDVHQGLDGIRDDESEEEAPFTVRLNVDVRGAAEQVSRAVDLLTRRYGSLNQTSYWCNPKWDPGTFITTHSSPVTVTIPSSSNEFPPGTILKYESTTPLASDGTFGPVGLMQTLSYSWVDEIKQLEWKLDNKPPAIEHFYDTCGHEIQKGGFCRRCSRR
jgi:hypothetical protein